MNYKIEGKGDILLFIHGLSDNLLYWEVLASHLKKYYQVIRVDLRDMVNLNLELKKFQ